MRTLKLTLLVLALSGCPHPPPPTPMPTPDLKVDLAQPPTAMASCPASVTETPDAVCDELFTHGGCANNTDCACVRCQGGQGCIDQSTQVYCVKGACLDDHACYRRGAPSTAGGAAGNGGKKSSAEPVPVVPKAELTPGAADPRVTQANIHKTICVPGYSKSVRPPVRITNKIKAATFASYGIKTDAPNDYELDHLISLELGGAPADEKNLWPEPWETRGHKVAARGTGAETKDKVENWLHRQVCADKIPLVDAQRQMATDWPSVLKEIPPK